jgi:hypothetical protein
LIFYLAAWGGAFTLFILIARFNVANLIPSAFRGVGFFSWIPLVFADSLISVYALTGVLLLLILVFLRRRYRFDISLLLSRRSAALGILGFFTTFVILNMTYTRLFIDLFPTVQELSILMMLLPLSLPLTFIDELWLRTIQQSMLPSRLRWGLPVVLSLLPKVVPLVIVSLMFGNLLLISGAILLTPALFTTWLFNETNSFLGGALYNALLFSWILAVVLPFG